jgi:nucleoside-diphosphate-sugar epimerase
VGAGSRITLLDLVDFVEDVVGTKVNVLHAPDRAGDVRDSQAGLARAESVLGYRPAVDVREGIRRLWTWYSAHPQAVETAGA